MTDYLDQVKLAAKAVRSALDKVPGVDQAEVFQAEAVGSSFGGVPGGDQTEAVGSSVGVVPDAVVILGSGLGGVIDSAEVLWQKSYAELPYFPHASAPGHKARLVLARVALKHVLFFQGRFHYYEGHSIQETAFPIKLAAHLGVSTVVLTNAAGGLNPDIPVGSLVLIKDHLSFFLPSPLRGANDDALGPRFPDMTAVYTPELQDLARSVASDLNLPLYSGIYCYMPGPQYESPAEIRALQTLGADLVGMSTVAEAITARHAGLKVLGVSTVTNLAAGLGEGHLSHDEVLEIGAQVSQDAGRFLTAFLAEL